MGIWYSITAVYGIYIKQGIQNGGFDTVLDLVRIECNLKMTPDREMLYQYGR